MVTLAAVLDPVYVDRPPPGGNSERAAQVLKTEATRCPVCSDGDLVEIAYQHAGEFEPSLQPDSVEILVFSCGHRVSSDARLSDADTSRLNVEQRNSEDTIDPLPEDTGTAPPDGAPNDPRTAGGQ